MKQSGDLKRLIQLTAELDEEDKMSSIVNGIANICPDEDMYADVLEIVLEVTGSKFGVFGYIDSVSGAFVCPSMTKDVWERCQVADKDPPVYTPEEWGYSIWGRSIREARTLYANKPFKNLPDGHIPIHKALMVPIVYRKKVIGLFEVANKEVDYTPKDIQLLEDIAKNVAPVLNARLRYQQAEQELVVVKERLERLEEGQISNAS